jgi:hypothetical protein
MLPLKIADLEIPPEMQGDPLIVRFIELWDATGRSEKISDPNDWTEEERAAYARGDTAAFSRLRGYTETEIAQFTRMVAAAHEVAAKYGEDSSAWIAHLVDQQTMPDRF